MVEKGRGGCAMAVIKFLFRFYAICVPAWRRAAEEKGRRDLMMMYRGRATERRENGRGGLPLYFHQRKKSLNTRKEREKKLL